MTNMLVLSFRKSKIVGIKVRGGKYGLDKISGI